MNKGNLDQSRKKQGSTLPARAVIEADAEDPEQIALRLDQVPDHIDERTHACYTAILDPTGQVYSDQTGKFVVPSSNGNNYLLVLYGYDSNYIFAQPFKNRTALCILAAYQDMHACLCKAGLKPKLQRLDNECLQLLKDFFDNNDINYQLFPPGVHRRNAAERTIHTFQNQFSAGLCSGDNDSPLHLWDRLLPQAEISLNLMRGSRTNLKLSAWTQIHGNFDYNRTTPLGPPGCRVLAHKKSEKRTTWSPHALNGWYTGRALESYRCYEVWIWGTRAVRTCDTVTWFPTKVMMSKSSSTDLILASLQDIAHALNKPEPSLPLELITQPQTSAGAACRHTH
jgi:hypothetical protein